MKTDDLILMLANAPATLPPRRGALHGTAPAVAGIALSFALMLLLLGVQANSLLHAMALPAFWLKVSFAAALALAGRHALRRLGRPGASVRGLALWIAAPLLLMWGLGAWTLIDAEPAARGALFWGSTWRYCTALIALLSLPVFAAMLHIMRSMAPTRLRLAGAAAGFTAGATAALIYCLHCPEMASSFVGFWYVLGMLVPTALGALIGRRVLAW